MLRPSAIDPTSHTVTERYDFGMFWRLTWWSSNTKGAGFKCDLWPDAAYSLHSLPEQDKNAGKQKHLKE